MNKDLSWRKAARGIVWKKKFYRCRTEKVKTMTQQVKLHNEDTRAHCIREAETGGKKESLKAK